VTLVAVTKYVTPAQVRPLLAAGCHDLGESRPQQLWDKAEALGDQSVRWHFIGHLQRNKIRRTLPIVHLFHSGDSLRLLKAVNQELQQQERSLPVLLEVNISGDVEKHGFSPQEVKSALPELLSLHWLRIRGLMAMSARESDQESARSDFAHLRELRDQLQDDAGDTADLSQLSMGMSRDFVTAIEEGATIVRVGSALFEGVAF
jgi:pyridoxal phosphate enzyme (YggS family)